MHEYMENYHLALAILFNIHNLHAVASYIAIFPGVANSFYVILSQYIYTQF